MSTQNIATVDFGPTPSETAQVAVTGQTSIVSGSLVEAWLVRNSTADNNTDMHELLARFFSISVGDIVAGTGFTIKLWSRYGFKATGTFLIPWVWN